MWAPNSMGDDATQALPGRPRSSPPHCHTLPDPGPHHDLLPFTPLHWEPVTLLVPWRRVRKKPGVTSEEHFLLPYSFLR